MLDPSLLHHAGPDYVSMTAGEAENPRAVMPRAYNAVFYRLTAFFVLGSLCVGINVPYNDAELKAAFASSKPGAAASPYVVAPDPRAAGHRQRHGARVGLLSREQLCLLCVTLAVRARARGQGAVLPDPLHAAGRPDLLCAGRAGPGSGLVLAGLGERGRCAAVVREPRHGVAAH